MEEDDPRFTDEQNLWFNGSLTLIVNLFRKRAVRNVLLHNLTKRHNPTPTSMESLWHGQSPRFNLAIPRSEL